METKWNFISLNLDSLGRKSLVFEVFFFGFHTLGGALEQTHQGGCSMQGLLSWFTVSSLEILFVSCLANLLLIEVHKFCMGFKSREFPGQFSKNFTLPSPGHIFMLSAVWHSAFFVSLSLRNSCRSFQPITPLHII